MPTYKLWQKAEVWYSAEVEADNEAHALRLHNAGMVEGWSMDMNTVQTEQGIEVQIIDGPDSFTTEDPEHFHLWQIHEGTAKCVSCGHVYIEQVN